jgi:hypothetical protein
MPTVLVYLVRQQQVSEDMSRLSDRCGSATCPRLCRRYCICKSPSPSDIVQIRDMTLVFINRTELLPAGESIEQHTKWQKEEADAVQQDKDNKDPRTGGLFKGCFRAQHARGPGPALQVVRDQEDGVERCPVCTWELEDGECVQCGLFFDDNGELTWTDSFTGFSDMDDMSERDLSGEDLDAEMDMEDADYDAYGAPGDWPDFYPDDGNFMMQRFLEHGIPAQAAFGHRRPMSHSEAGSRRSYTQSIVSDMFTDEMDTVEEEDEDGIDEDSSMNDFIDDEGGSSTSASASSTPGPAPQPSNARVRLQGRARRVVESEASSTISSVVEEDEDEEDEGPIRRGQRNRAHTRILQRANGSSEPSAPSSSTSTDASMDELDQDTEALLQSEGWMLQHNGTDELGEDDDDDDSDGGRTTVGWDATAISNDRVRMGGSLTPTADRPRLDAPIRPPSRVGNPLRRQSSILSTSNAHYEDGEADDDDSDLDQEGDITTAAMTSLRNRRSRTQLRNAAAFATFNNRFANRGLPQGEPADVDADDHSDHSQPGNQRRSRPQEYNPRISRLFADHQRALQELQGGPLLDLEPRSSTPLARPRTANRNRPSPAQAYSPFMPPAPTRLRTPLMNNSSNPAMNARPPVSPPRRTTPSQSLAEIVNGDITTRVERAPSVSASSNASVILTPGTSTPTSQYSSSTISRASVGTAIDMVDRPPSRVSRPPSAAGRRGSAGFSPVYPTFPHTNVGLNIQGRIFPAQGNPWASFVRSRNSRQVLRDQSSTATLRAASSRTNIREGLTSPQGVRPQASRINLRPQPSRRQLNTQSSTRTLRASEHARPPPSPTANVTVPTQPPTQTNRFTNAERQTLARELVNDRMRALGQGGAVPARNNPFVPGFRRPSIPSEVPIATGAVAAPQHVRSNSNESMNSGSSSHTATTIPSSPGLTRRRSSRQINAAPPGVLQPVHGGFQHPVTTYPNNYFRARQNSLNGSSAFDVPLDANARGLSPMVATSLI